MAPHLQRENYRFRNVSQSYGFTVSTSLMEPIAYISWTNIEGDLMARSLYVYTGYGFLQIVGFVLASCIRT